MASAQVEIQYFVDKFAHLTSLGFNTNIQFNSYEGRISVIFQADLGMFTQPPQPLAHTLLVQHQMKPSKMRRYARREENRHLHEKNESSSAVHIVLINQINQRMMVSF